MPGYLAFRDGGKTTQEGFSRHILKFFTAGVLGANDLKVSQRAAGANLSVDVAPGDLLIDSGLGFPWHGYIKSTENVSAITPDPSNPRKVIIVAYADESVVSSATDNNLGATKFFAVHGTPAGFPLDPSDATIQAAVGGTNEWRKLARINLGTSGPIVNANIDDLRTISKINIAAAVNANALGAIVTSPTITKPLNDAAVTGLVSQLRVGSAANGTYNIGGDLNISSLNIPATAAILNYEFWVAGVGNTNNQGAVRALVSSISPTAIHFECQISGNDAGFPNLTNSTVSGYVRYIN